jgi:hypothetical protein
VGIPARSGIVKNRFRFDEPERFFFFRRAAPGSKNELSAGYMSDSGLTFTVFCVKVR